MGRHVISIFVASVVGGSPLMSALTLRSGAAGGATGAFVVAALQALGNHYPGLHLGSGGCPYRTVHPPGTLSVRREH